MNNLFWSVKPLSILEQFEEFTCKGKGTITAKNKEYNVDFIVKQLQNGRITGNLQTELPSFMEAFRFTKLGEFDLNGKVEKGESIILKDCYLTSIKTENSSVSAEFLAFEALVNPEKLKEKPTNEIFIHFEVLNIDRTFRVIVDTRLAELCLREFEDIEDRLRINKLLGMSSITAVVELSKFTKDLTRLTFEDILTESANVVDGFLYITSLAQTCFHSWCSVLIYEKINDSDKFQLILRKMRSPKEKRPTYGGITNAAHSANFISSAYEGYRNNEELLKESYGFDIALELYLESNIATVAESKCIMAYVCLEFLIDRHQKISEEESIIDRQLFEANLYPELKNAAGDIMRQLGLSSEVRSEIYRKLSGINRYSFKRKIEMLLNHLKITYDDLFADLQLLVNIRNDLIHRGIHKDFKKLVDAYNRLKVLLTRVFLSLLDYNDSYFDLVKQDWVKFDEVIKNNT